MDAKYGKDTCQLQQCEMRVGAESTISDDDVVGLKRRVDPLGLSHVVRP